MINKFIDWETKKEALTEYLNAGLSYKEISKFYDVKPRTIGSIINSLGLHDFYKHKQEPWKKYELTEEDKEGLSNEVINRLSKFKNVKYKYTRKFIASELTKNIKAKIPIGIIVKEDIIDQFNVTRENKHKFNYDFSKLPEFVKGTHEKFTILVNEISPKTHKLVGEWVTDFKSFIILETENGVCSGILTKRIFAYSNEEFIEYCKSKFGDTYGYDKVNYVNLNTPVTLKCNKCGKYFSQRPNELIYGKGVGCPACAMKQAGEKRFMELEEFSRRCIEIYGDIYDFSETKYNGIERPLTVKNKITGELITATPAEFFRGHVEEDNKSFGEKVIYNWLLSKNIKFEYNKRKKSKLFKRKSKSIKVDFIVKLFGIIFWIEYNGLQHYYVNEKDTTYFTKEKFKSQCLRDDSEKEYCLLNGIELIEIPYTYNTSDKIIEVLERIFIQRESKDFIKLPKRQKV